MQWIEKANALGFLSEAGCAQDENHFSWILKYLLENDRTLREAFVREVLGKEIIDELRGFRIDYQHTAPWSRPDLVIHFSRGASSYLVFVETKVRSKVDPDQLSRHLQSMEAEKWLYSRPNQELITKLVVLAPRDSLAEGLPPGCVGLAWEDVNGMLRTSTSDSNETPLGLQLAMVLEARNMADFNGFDVEAWKDYLELHQKNAKLIETVETQCGNFVTAVKRLAQKAIVAGRPPFGEYESTFHDRGKDFEFYICPKRTPGQESHWAIVKVIPDEGLIEVSAGTYSGSSSAAFLKAVGRSEATLKSAGWVLWYQGGGLEDYVELESWSHLMEMGVSEISLARLRRIAADRDILSEPAAVQQAFDDLGYACQFLVDLLG